MDFVNSSVFSNVFNWLCAFVKYTRPIVACALCSSILFFCSTAVAGKKKKKQEKIQNTRQKLKYQLFAVIEKLTQIDQFMFEGIIKIFE